MNPIPAIRGVAIGAFLALALGCSGSSPPDPSDPAAGRELLQSALEAWKDGKSLDEHRTAAAPVDVNDRAWKSGAKLVEYEIAGEPAQSGYDVQFKVALTVQDPGGAKKKQKALFNVSTTPRRTVQRAEGSW